MTIASHNARIDRTPHTATRAAWLFAGRIQRALVINWRQAAIKAMVHDLRVARELEQVKDLAQIAGLRLLSAQCSMALARCRAERDAAEGGSANARHDPLGNPPAAESRVLYKVHQPRPTRRN